MNASSPTGLRRASPLVMTQPHGIVPRATAIFHGETYECQYLLTTAIPGALRSKGNINFD